MYIHFGVVGWNPRPTPLNCFKSLALSNSACRFWSRRFSPVRGRAMFDLVVCAGELRVEAEPLLKLPSSRRNLFFRSILSKVAVLHWPKWASWWGGGEEKRGLVSSMPMQPLIPKAGELLIKWHKQSLGVHNPPENCVKTTTKWPYIQWRGCTYDIKPPIHPSKMAPSQFMILQSIAHWIQGKITSNLTFSSIYWPYFSQ